MFAKVRKGTDLYVTMSNELIRSAHGLGINEKRLLMLAVSKLDSKAKPDPKNMVARVNVSEMINEFGIEANSAYKETKLATEGIKKRYIRFFHPDIDGKQLETVMNWVGRSTYKEDEAWVELAFWHELTPMLFELKAHFTSYKLNRASAFQSVYSWRLFELLMQFKSTGFLVIPINEFSEVMEAPKSYLRDFSLLRTRAIEPAIKEIRGTDGLKVSWEPIKAGRKVKALKFTFPVEQQAVLPLKKKKTKTTPKTPEQKTQAENAADIAHYRRMAELSGEPLETILPQHLKEKTTT